MQPNGPNRARPMMSSPTASKPAIRSHGAPVVESRFAFAMDFVLFLLAFSAGAAFEWALELDPEASISPPNVFVSDGLDAALPAPPVAADLPGFDPRSSWPPGWPHVAQRDPSPPGVARARGCVAADDVRTQCYCPPCGGFLVL
jgi:hypothetical protein